MKEVPKNFIEGVTRRQAITGALASFLVGSSDALAQERKNLTAEMVQRAQNAYEMLSDADREIFRNTFMTDNVTGLTEVTQNIIADFRTRLVESRIQNKLQSIAEVLDSPALCDQVVQGTLDAATTAGTLESPSPEYQVLETFLSNLCIRPTS
jgi:hypothetical protein